MGLQFLVSAAINIVFFFYHRGFLKLPELHFKWIGHNILGYSVYFCTGREFCKLQIDRAKVFYNDRQNHGHIKT